MNPIKWDMGYFDCLFGHEWELTKSPAGAHQWKPKKNGVDINVVQDAHDPTKKHPPMMLTTDLSMRMDPKYGPISKIFIKTQMSLQMHLQEPGLSLRTVIWDLVLVIWVQKFQKKN